MLSGSTLRRSEEVLLLERAFVLGKDDIHADAGKDTRHNKQQPRTMADDEVLEGHLIIYYQHNHGVESKLMEIRHSENLEISTYNHNCLKHSHTCVDIMLGIGTAHEFRRIIKVLQNTPNVNKIAFNPAPMRDEGCC